MNGYRVTVVFLRDAETEDEARQLVEDGLTAEGARDYWIDYVEEY